MKKRDLNGTRKQFSKKEGNGKGIKEQQKKILRHRKQQNSRHKFSLISNYIKCKLIEHSNPKPVNDRMGKKTQPN